MSAPIAAAIREYRFHLSAVKRVTCADSFPRALSRLQRLRVDLNQLTRVVIQSYKASSTRTFRRSVPSRGVMTACESRAGRGSPSRIRNAQCKRDNRKSRHHTTNRPQKQGPSHLQDARRNRKRACISLNQAQCVTNGYDIYKVLVTHSTKKSLLKQTSAINKARDHDIEWKKWQHRSAIEITRKRNFMDR